MAVTQCRSCVTAAQAMLEAPEEQPAATKARGNFGYRTNKGLNILRKLLLCTLAGGQNSPKA